MTTPLVLSENCKGPNAACRKAHRAGRTVHVIPPMGCHLVLPTCHFTTVDEGMAAIRDAMVNAPTVATDDDLYAYRAAGVAHFLPAGWVDPTRR